MILSDSNAYVESSTLDSGHDVTVTATNMSLIHSTVVAASASAAAGKGNSGTISIGASRARNYIGYELDGTLSPAESQAYILNSSIDATGALNVTSTADQTIEAHVGAGSVAFSGAGSNAIALSGAGVETINRVSVLVNALIDGSGTDGIVADSINVSADDTSSISANAGAAALAIAAAGTGGAAWPSVLPWLTTKSTTMCGLESRTPIRSVHALVT